MTPTNEPKFTFETGVAQRAIEPLWMQQAQCTLDPRYINLKDPHNKLQFTILHRRYNENYLENMQKVETLGKFEVPLKEIIKKMDCESSFEKWYPVQLVKKASTNKIPEVFVKFHSIPGIKISKREKSFSPKFQRDTKKVTFGQDFENDFVPEEEFRPETIANVFKTLEEINQSGLGLDNNDYYEDQDEEGHKDFGDSFKDLENINKNLDMASVK